MFFHSPPTPPCLAVPGWARTDREEGQGLALDADGNGVVSPISATTVVHHHSGDDEYWTVLTGTTVVAHCITLEQASGLADSMNDAKRAGDEFDETRRYRPVSASLVAPPKPVRCQGLDITPRLQVAQVLEPQLPPPA